MKKQTKDNLVGLGLTTFMGTLGAMITYGCEVKTMIGGIAGALVGVIAGAAFKESRRGIHETRPKKFYLPYIGGAVISSGLAALMWLAI